MFKLAGALLLLLSLPTVGRAAWWNNDWNFRKEITFDLTPAGANVSGTPIDVPILVRLHLGNFAYFNDTKADGSDLRFVAGDDKTPLKFHIERYDPTNQIAFVWVRIPRIAGGTNNEKVYLYYGNAKAPAAADGAGTYDVNQTLVYHLSESQAAAGGSHRLRQQSRFCNCRAEFCIPHWWGREIVRRHINYGALEFLTACDPLSGRDAIGLDAYGRCAVRCLRLRISGQG